MFKHPTIYHQINYYENMIKKIRFYFIIEELLKENFKGE